MEWNFLFFLNSILLGVGLAMDAFSVSVADGLNESGMRPGKGIGIASVFAFFQIAMPMIGWICIHYFITYFNFFDKFIPWISLILLLYIGIGMLRGSGKAGEEETASKLTIGSLLMQGIATSIDALSIGFTIAEYPLSMALTASFLIGAVTFVVCIAGIRIGKVFGNRFSGRAERIGGIILILIGIEIFIKGIIA